MSLVTPTSGGLGIEIPITSDSKQFTDSVDRVNKKLKELEGLAKENAQLSSKIGTAQEQSAKKATMSWTDFRSMYQTVLDVVRVGQQVWAATGGEFVKYAEQVKNLSRSLGSSAEEASKIIQVGDDVRISYESLTIAMKTAQKQGIDPSIEGLAKLSDKYKSLAPGVERTQFLLKTFGKSGLEMGKLMEKGGDGIRSASDAISENLIMTAKGIKASDDYQAQVDELSDTWLGLKIKAGEVAIPFINDRLRTLNNNIAEHGTLLGYAETVWDNLTGNLDEAGASTEDVTQAMDDNTGAIGDNAAALDTQKEAVKAAEDALKNYQDALEAVSQANLDMEGMSRQIAQDQKAYAEDHADAVDKEREAVEKLKEAETKDYGKGKNAAANKNEAIQAAQEGVAEARKSIDELQASWHEASQNMIYDMVLVGLSVGGLLDSEQKALDEYAVTAGIKTQADIDEANRRREIADSTIAGILQSEDVLTEQRKVDAETLRLTSAVTSAENIAASQQEAAAIGGVSQATMQEINNQMMLAGAARTTASVYASIKPGYSASLPTGISKSMADPRRGRTAQYALGGEFMIPMQYGNEGFNMGGMATASGGEKVTITPKGQAAGGTTFYITINNPKREAAEDSIKSALRNLVYTGSAN